MGSVNYVLNMSGGKDSTAMLLEMRERGIPIHSAVMFDTGWEFPQMFEHIHKLEKYTGIKITVVSPKVPFSVLMMEREIQSRKKENKGDVVRVGYGWPGPLRRWCTRVKVKTIEAHIKDIDNVVSCIGYAADEAHRTQRKTLKRKTAEGFKYRFPLIEWGIDEPKALGICYSYGFDWGGAI